MTYLEKLKNEHFDILHGTLCNARILEALYSIFLVEEQLPADVPRHDLLLVLIEVAILPANVEPILHVGIILSQHRLPKFLVLAQLGLPHARSEKINPFDAE